MFAASAPSVDAVSEAPPAASNPFDGDAGGFGGGFGEGFGASFGAPTPSEGGDEGGGGFGASFDAPAPAASHSCAAAGGAEEAAPAVSGFDDGFGAGAGGFDTSTP
jgi:hypothetical protein